MAKRDSKDMKGRYERARAAAFKPIDADMIAELFFKRVEAADDEARAEASLAWDLLTERLQCLASNYANFVLAPRHFAKVRRAAGDVKAAPADYDCRCNVRDPDGVPICGERRAPCRFVSLRRSHNAQPNNFTGLDDAWFEVHRTEQKAILASFKSDFEAVARKAAEMERELAKANARRCRSFGEGFPMASRAWLS